MSKKSLTNSYSIIIPAYKEEKTIEKTVKGIINIFKENHLELEVVIVIDKVPNDSTFDIVNELSKSFKEIKIISREGRQGVASAIIEGIKNVQNSVTIIVMGDSSEDPKDLVKMALKMNEGYDMVFANRFSNEGSLTGYPKSKMLANRLCNWSIRILFGINSKDITNAVKAYKSEILKKLQISSTGFEVFAELPIKSYRKGYHNFVEISAIHEAGDPNKSKFKISVEGPKYFKLITKCFFEK